LASNDHARGVEVIFSEKVLAMLESKHSGALTPEERKLLE
jgi:hypothetical protein